VGHLHVLEHAVNRIGAEHVITVDPDGSRLFGELDPPEEVHLHCELFHARPEINAVAHTHSDHVVAAAAAGLDLTPVDRRTARFGPSVPVMETPGSLSIATPQAGKMLAATLGHHDVVVLAGHGAVAVGTTPEAATVAALDLDRLARIRLAIGNAVSARAEIHRTDVDASYVQEAIEIGWRYWSSPVE
jgi:L-fuculose-phosphate aldolase